MIQLKNYQQDAIERLYATVINLLGSAETEICIFQSPTGSGKTLMVAEFLKQLVMKKEINTKFVFQRPIINAGRSLAVTLPADLVQYYKLKKGEKIKLIPESKNEIRISLS